MSPNALLSYKVSFHLFILHPQGIKKKKKIKSLGAFHGSGVFTGSFTPGKRKRFILEYSIYFTSLPTLILKELLEGRLHPSYLLATVPRPVAGRVGAHGTVLVSQASLTQPGLFSTILTQHCMLGHFIINTICFLCHMYTVVCRLSKTV